MSNDGPRVSFSFSKIKKSALISKVNVEPKEKIDYVDCFDGSKGKFSYKGTIRNDCSLKQELIIPMPTSRTSTDILKSKLEEKLNRNVELNTSNKAEKNKSENNKESLCQNKNLEELAALEILNEVKHLDVDNKTINKLIIETKGVPQEPSETDIDYDNIPVTDFGLAMLRGMGWKPNVGIGKEPRLVESLPPKLRPKGLGLGAQLNAEASKDRKDEKKSGKMSSSDKKSEKTDRNYLYSEY